MIKLNEHNKEKQKVTFVSDISPSLINAIRRSVLEIPTLAIDEVEIMQNDSALFDEILAHRMGLIPIKTPKVSGKEIMFKLKKDGPGIVYSGDLIPSVGTEDKLPISILDEEQKIELNAIARLGKGIEHIKYSPGLVFYKHDLENELLDFVKIDDSGKVSFNEEELKSKGLTEEKINKIRKLNKINEVLVTLESWGQIEVKELFLKAIEALNKNLDELSKTVK